MANTFRRGPWPPLSDFAKALSESVKEKAEALEAEILKAPHTRERAVALTNLEQSVMWAVKGITAGG